MIVKRFLSIINNCLLIIYSLKKTILPKVKLITNMEIQKIQKCMFLNLKLPKFCLKWLIFPRFFLASYSSRGIPRIEIPHSSFLIEGLTSLVPWFALVVCTHGLHPWLHFFAYFRTLCSFPMYTRPPCFFDGQTTREVDGSSKNAFSFKHHHTEFSDII